MLNEIEPMLHEIEPLPDPILQPVDPGLHRLESPAEDPAEDRGRRGDHQSVDQSPEDIHEPTSPFPGEEWLPRRA